MSKTRRTLNKQYFYLMILMPALFASCANNEDIDLLQDLPMSLTISDSEGDHKGKISVIFVGESPPFFVDEDGVTHISHPDTPPDAPINVEMEMALMLAGSDAANTMQLYMSPATWGQLNQNKLIQVKHSSEPLEHDVRAVAPMVYLPDQIRDDPAHRARTPAHVRELSTMQLQRRADKSVVLTLDLGPIAPYTNYPTATNAAPEARMQFTGPLSLSCSVYRGGQAKLDPRWESPELSPHS